MVVFFGNPTIIENSAQGAVAPATLGKARSLKGMVDAINISPRSVSPVSLCCRFVVVTNAVETGGVVALGKFAVHLCTYLSVAH